MNDDMWQCKFNKGTEITQLFGLFTGTSCDEYQDGQESLTWLQTDSDSIGLENNKLNQLFWSEKVLLKEQNNISSFNIWCLFWLRKNWVNVSCLLLVRWHWSTPLVLELSISVHNVYPEQSKFKTFKHPLKPYNWCSPLRWQTTVGIGLHVCVLVSKDNEHEHFFNV